MYMLLWALNLSLVYWNIRCIAKIWVDARHAGGRKSLLAMTGAAITALCLTWNILVMEAYLGSAFGLVSVSLREKLLGLAWLVVVPDLVVAYAANNFKHWAENYRTDLYSQVDTLYLASYLDLHQSYHTAGSIGEAVKGALGAIFSDDDGLGHALIVLIMAVTLLSGVLLTAVGIWYFAGRDEVEVPQFSR